MAEQPQRDTFNVVIVGHVDHGKSTVVGRLLADTGALPQGKLESVRRECERTGKPFEYAFLLDALSDEQDQGITIDTARCFFKSKTRDYIIIDAPGHIEFLKNMISGAARAEAAVLVIDAKEGVRENSRRHGYILSAPDRVEARLVEAIRRQFVARVLDPKATEPRVGAVLEGGFAAMRDGLARDCATYQAAFDGFVRREARRVERQAPAQGWVPEPLWRAGSASFGPICRPPTTSDSAGLRAKFIELIEANTANSPITDVIVRMARPFATKLISFVALPVIVAAILGGVILPLFRLLPGVLSGIVIGVLTGAVGGLVIGFAASASVDWLLNRTDAALNRPGFEIDVSRAVVAGQSDFLARVIEARRRAIDDEMQQIANRLAGQPGA